MSHPVSFAAAGTKPELITLALVTQLVELARNAGQAIMAIYENRDGYSTQRKLDDSPLTAADLAAHQIIVNKLPQLLDLPIISEEGELPPFSERSQWNCYWLIDPLDGTKEFIAGNGEFTVNIALIEQGRPVLGIVHVPVSDTTYVGVISEAENNCEAAIAGAWRYQYGQNPERIHVRTLDDRIKKLTPFTVLVSRRHTSSETEELIARLRSRWEGGIDIANAGSSLKFCRIAEGKADFYPRLGPTSEWDTAAAQAVLEAAGGQVVYATSSNAELAPLGYNTTEHLLNPHFYACGDRSFCWYNLLRL